MASMKKKMQYSFRQQHFPGLIQGRLDYVFISHNFQEVVKDSEILCAMWTDHSALFCSFQCFSKLKKGLCLWKFNNSLVLNEVSYKNAQRTSKKLKNNCIHKLICATKQNGKLWNMKSIFLPSVFQKILHN